MAPANKPLCVGCKNTLPQKEYLSCSVCKAKYDLLCANIPMQRYQDMEKELKRTWKCPECYSKQPKKDNTNTPIRSNTSDLNSNTAAIPTSRTTRDSALAENITVRRKQELSRTSDRDQPELSPTEEQKSFLAEIRAIRVEFTEIRAARLEMCELKTTISELADILRKSDERMDTLENRVQLLENRTFDFDKLETKILQLELELKDKEQQMLSNDLDISGIPEANGESITHIVLSIATKLGIDLEQGEIASATRMGLPRAALADEPAPRPRPIAVRLTTRSKRDALLKSARVRRGATTAEMGIANTPRRFYLNERLTKFNRQMFQEARLAATRAKWRYVWTRDGKIYARREDGAERIRIRTEADLVKVFGKNTV